MHSPASAARFQLNHFRAGSTPSVRSVKPSSRARMGGRKSGLGHGPGCCISRSSSPRACETTPALPLCLTPCPQRHSRGHPGSLHTRLMGSEGLDQTSRTPAWFSPGHSRHQRGSGSTGSSSKSREHHPVWLCWDSPCPPLLPR